MSELARVVAYVFRRHGRDAMGRNEFKQALSFGLNWFPPAQAARILERAVQAGLLAEQGEQVRVAFATAQVELPLGFRGSPLALDEPIEGVATALPATRAGEVAPAQHDDAALRERAKALRALSKGALSEQAARLLAARERGADVRNEAGKRLQELRASARPGPDSPRSSTMAPP